MTVRCYAPPCQWTDDLMTIDREERHHLTRVMRLREGDAVECLDGCGCIAQGIVQAEGVALLSQRREPRPRVELALFQAVLKGPKMELLIQKATELGIASITAVQTDQAVVRMKAADQHKRIDRWRKIAIAAIKQSGRAWLPDFPTPVAAKQLNTALADYPVTLLCSLDSTRSQPLKNVLKNISLDPPEKLAFLIGPEGDFTPAEESVLAQANANYVDLGQAVLRAETAAIYLLSVLNYTLLN